MLLSLLSFAAGQALTVPVDLAGNEVCQKKPCCDKHKLPARAVPARRESALHGQSPIPVDC
jgi:hypothetical protein